MDKKQPLQVVAAVFYQKNRILLTQRPLDKSYGGEWEFPGGKIKAGEDYESALVRELWEELKVRICKKELQLLGSVRNQVIHLHFYLAPLTQAYYPQEHPATAWCSLKELTGKNLCPADAQAIADFGDRLRAVCEK